MGHGPSYRPFCRSTRRESRKANPNAPPPHALQDRIFFTGDASHTLPIYSPCPTDPTTLWT